MKTSTVLEYSLIKYTGAYIDNGINSVTILKDMHLVALGHWDLSKKGGYCTLFYNCTSSLSGKSHNNGFYTAILL